MAAVPLPIGANWQIKDEIKKARTEAHLQQADIAEAAGVSRQLVSKWERGIGEPTISQYRAIADVTGATWLLHIAKLMRQQRFSLVPSQRGPMELALGVHRPALDIVTDEA